MKSLREIWENDITLRSDKWLPYFDVYETFFSKWRGRSPVFMEVGIQGGGSMQMWQQYFGKGAEIYGVDIDPAAAELPLDDIKVIIGDQERMSFWNTFLYAIKQIDLFLDDGGHTMNQQINTLLSVWPKISHGGIYMCEDLHTSYWTSHGGGLKKPATMIEACKDIVDLMHAEHIESVELPMNLYEIFKDVGSVHFYNSIVVLTKGKSEFTRKIVNEQI